ncbi:small integral membrane protein 14 isoform X2 [Prinia subflava]|uniref:small integral membrane protein 14 isoform X2 n=1 Tax=Prinia subflava TaxID=208062 RepID=UPI002FE2DEE8
MAPARPCTRSGPSPEAPGRRTVKEHPWEGSGSAVAGEMSEVSLRKQLAQGAAESSQKEAKLPIFRFCSGCSGKHDLYQVSKSFVFLCPCPVAWPGVRVPSPGWNGAVCLAL